MSRVARPRPDQQDAGGVGVEGAGVAHPPLAEDPPAPGHHVVGGPAGLLVDHHQPGDRLGPGGTHRVDPPSSVLAGPSSRPRILAEHVLDPPPGHDGRVGGELQLGRPLHPDLSAHGALQLGPPLVQSLGRVLGQRAQVDGGVAQVGRRVHRGHRDQPEPLVGVGQPLELLGQHLAQHLVDPQRAGVGGRPPLSCRRLDTAPPLPPVTHDRAAGTADPATQVRGISRSS